MAEGFHPFPSRTRKLSPHAPMILLRRESRSLPDFFLSFFCFYINDTVIFLFLNYPYSVKSAVINGIVFIFYNIFSVENDKKR